GLHLDGRGVFDVDAETLHVDGADEIAVLVVVEDGARVRSRHHEEAAVHERAVIECDPDREQVVVRMRWNARAWGHSTGLPTPADFRFSFEPSIRMCSPSSDSSGSRIASERMRPSKNACCFAGDFSRRTAGRSGV